MVSCSGIWSGSTHRLACVAHRHTGTHHAKHFYIVLAITARQHSSGLDAHILEQALEAVALWCPSGQHLQRPVLKSWIYDTTPSLTIGDSVDPVTLSDEPDTIHRYSLLEPAEYIQHRPNICHVNCVQSYYAKKLEFPRSLEKDITMNYA